MKILITRPSPEGEKLTYSLNNIGIPAWHFSLFKFFPSISKKSLPKKFYELYTSDVIIVFSKKSIYYTNLFLKKNNLQWPSYPEYYAIGNSTALFLYKYIKKKIFTPLNIENSENLLKLLENIDLNNSKITLLQGEKGRQLVRNSLKKKVLIYL